MRLMWLLFIFAGAAHGLPQGAPTKVCNTLLPFHGGGIPRQETQSPFSITPLRRSGNVFLTVGSNLNVPFKGFMMQARAPNGEVVGTFEASVATVHTIDCENPGDTLTHSNTDARSVLEVEWKPEGYEGPVIFNATVAQEYNMFWVGVESDPIEISKRSIDDPLPPPRAPSTTTPPNFTPERNRETAIEFDGFYDGCNVRKTCFGSPSGCVDSKNCKAATAISVIGDRFEFELKAEVAAAWVGVGLSGDDKMGDDSVIECVKDGNNVRSYTSWTTPRPNLGVNRLPNSQLGIELLNGSIVDGEIYCKVRRDAKTTINGQVFDLVNDKYYLVVAAGSKVEATKVSFHDLSYLPSGESKSLSDVSAVVAASKILLRLHGAFMLAAWLGTASVGMFLARYYRQTWVGSTMCGKDLWFAWHRFFMIITWALTVVGFILIFVELKAWTSDTSNPHAVLGVITTFLCCMQPIGAYFRPHPGTPKRPIFNWCHWLAGNVAHILAIITIFFAAKLNKAELPDWFDWILVGYVAFHVIMHLLLSVMSCVADGSDSRRITSIPMKNLGSPRGAPPHQEQRDKPMSTARKILLAIYALIVLAFVIALIVIEALAPIEEFWNSLKNTV